MCQENKNCHREYCNACSMTGPCCIYECCYCCKCGKYEEDSDCRKKCNEQKCCEDDEKCEINIEVNIENIFITL